MHCDQVFEILTRGPFPSGGADDAIVELHLTACHDCRQLAEVLRPAVELMHEALDADQADDLPGYRGVLPVAEESGHSVTVEAVMRRVGVLPMRSPFRSPAVSAWLNSLTLFRVAAAVVLGVGCGLFFQAIGMYAGLVDDANPAVGAKPPTINAKDLPPFQALASLSLPTACLRPSGDDRPGMSAASSPSLPRSTNFQCCRDCHKNLDAKSPPPSAMSIALQHCNACHAGK